MIGITGVTGNIGSYVADLVDKKGIASVHLARSPERAKVYASAEIRRMSYTNTPKVVEALKGIDTLLMVSARENPERVKEHKEFLDTAKLAGVQHIVYTSFYGADEKATFTLSRDHAQTEAYIKELGFTYTFLRDNFYLDFLIDMALENGEIRGPAGSGQVSAVARKDTSRVAAEILLNPKEWENQSLNLTGPEELSMEEIHEEMKAIADTGLEEILILTGESRKASDVKYIGEACKIAKKYFKNIGIEVYPMNSDEYRYLRECGADYVTVFQETYNSDKYETLHLAGHKRIFPYRFNAQERALMGGMRGVAFAALLGLDDFRKDALGTGMHAYLIQRKYPWAEISISCPRLRPIINNASINPKDVHEKQLLQIMCAYRLFLPFAGMTISTRERAEFRDNVVGLAATKISAGVSTGIGSHSESEDKGDAQFEIADTRGLDEIYESLKKRGIQPVMNDYVYV